MKESPSTQLFFDNKIARVIFEGDESREAYWINISALLSFRPYHTHHLHNLHKHLYRHDLPYYVNRCDTFLFPIEDWLIEHNLPIYPTKLNEDDWIMFKLRWL